MKNWPRMTLVHGGCESNHITKQTIHGNFTSTNIIRLLDSIDILVREFDIILLVERMRGILFIQGLCFIKQIFNAQILIDQISSIGNLSSLVNLRAQLDKTVSIPCLEYLWEMLEIFVD